MTNLFPVDIQITMLFESLVDEETGEITATDEEIEAAIAQINLDFDEKIAQLRNRYKQMTLDAKIIEAEAKTLRDEAAATQKRANSLNNRADRLKGFIAYLLNGEPYKKNGVSVSYRETERCEVDEDFLAWALVNAPDLLESKPSISKIKEQIKTGCEFEKARIVKNRAVIIK